jgi:cobalamin biosynthesis protein CobT
MADKTATPKHSSRCATTHTDSAFDSVISHLRRRGLKAQQLPTLDDLAHFRPWIGSALQSIKAGDYVSNRILKITSQHDSDDGHEDEDEDEDENDDDTAGQHSQQESDRQDLSDDGEEVGDVEIDYLKKQQKMKR